jgi:hypothetical protein
VADDPSQISRAGAALEMTVPSTARPAAPKILYVLPTFEWSRTTTPGGALVRMRKGGAVRVYLERPWHSSGEGELLGVVLADPAAYPPNDAQRAFVTHWGNDPIWATDPVADAPQPFSFPGAVTVDFSLKLDELAAVAGALPPGGDRVHVAGHAVEFDKDRKLWYCDIKIDAGASYWPFVRLALARYQPISYSGVELSRVVLADFVRLPPDRTVTVTPAGSPDHFDVRVDGLTYLSNFWNSWNSGPDIDVPRPDLVEVSIEERIPGTSDELGWRPVGSDGGVQVQIASALGAGGSPVSGTALWAGQVVLPASRSPGQFRIVVKEFEHLLDDDRRVVRVPVDPTDLPAHHKGPPLFQNVTVAPGGGRLVFAETISL